MNEKIRNKIDSELSGYMFVTDERLEKLESAAPRKEIRMKINKKVIGIGIAAAVAVGSAVTVGAVNSWNYAGVVERLFPRAVTEQTQPVKYDTKEEALEAERTRNTEPVPELVEEAAALLDGIMHPVAPENIISDTFRNFDVVIDGYVFDGSNLKVCATYRRKDGKPIEYKNGDWYESFVEAEAEGLTITPSSWHGSSMDDGSLQVNAELCIREGEVTEPTKATLTLSYLLYNGSMKKPHDIEAEDPETVYDDGVLTAEIELLPNEKAREFVLTDNNGDTVTVRIAQTYIRVEFTPFDEANVQTDRWMHLLSDTMFAYDEDGNAIVSPFGFAGGTGNEIGGYVELTLAAPIDTGRIASLRVGNYKYGDVPPLDTEAYGDILEFYGVEE